ncbi:MAG: PEP-CTERM sorting domain-containing protein [Terracidiphilus sp.]
MIRTTSVPKNLRLARSLPLVVAAMAAVLSLGATAHAGNIVSDPGFESAGGGNTYYAAQSIDGGSWIVGGGASTVYIDNLDPYVYDGNNSANLTAFTAYASSSLYQNLTTVVGQLYSVNFWANSDSPNTLSLTENGLAISGLPGSVADNGFPDQVDPLGNSSLFVEYSGLFVATSTTTDLMFTAYANPTLAELEAGDGSVVIDDVNVSPTPEPGSIVLMLTGIVGLGLLIGRKRLGLSLSSGSMPA